MPGRPPFSWRTCSSRHIMNLRFLCFCATTWTAAAILLLGHDSIALEALSGVVALAGFDLFRP